MATTFLEPGGDADFLVGTTNGFWDTVTNAPAIVTDFVHGNHIKSIQYRASNNDIISTASGTVSDAGSRISFYVYFIGFASVGATVTLAQVRNATNNIGIRINSSGVLQLWNNAVAQIGTNGATLSTGIWYRISLAYTITSTTVNRFELFVDGVSSISITNATIALTVSTFFRIGNVNTNSGLDFRSSDHYIDNSNSLTDTGDIWVTAKRPVADGTSVQFTTQIGAGGSGYGSGHSPQVNERPLSVTNGWSIQSASKQTEEYTIEAKNVGDIDISSATIVDYMGWISCKVGSNSTGNIIVGGTATNISVTTTATLFKKIVGSSTYPAGNTDIGMDTNTVNQLFSLYECGVLVAYIPTIVTNNSGFFNFI